MSKTRHKCLSVFALHDHQKFFLKDLLQELLIHQFSPLVYSFISRATWSLHGRVRYEDAFLPRRCALLKSPSTKEWISLIFGINWDHQLCRCLNLLMPSRPATMASLSASVRIPCFASIFYMSNTASDVLTIKFDQMKVDSLKFVPADLFLFVETSAPKLHILYLLLLYSLLWKCNSQKPFTCILAFWFLESVL